MEKLRLSKLNQTHFSLMKAQILKEFNGETSKDIAHYSILHDSKQLYAAKYLTFLPTEEQLRNEIERQKQIFLEQEKDEK